MVLYFDLFDTLIKVNRGYLEEYFDKELDKLGDIGALKDSISTINEIVKKYPEVLDKYSVEEMTSYYEKVMKDSLMNVDKDILTMLDQLKELGYKMCIISDATYVDIMHFDESPIAKYFDNKVFSCEYGIAKPDNKIYQIALDIMGNPSRSFFVGDGGHDELIGAKRNGMKTIKVEWFKRNINYEDVDCVINIPSYLVEMINSDLSIVLNIDKEPYIKNISDDRIINLTGESGSGKSYFSNKWKDDDNYIIIDTDIVFSESDSDNKESIEVRKLFVDKSKDYLINDFDDFYVTILDYFKDTDKFVVIDSAQYRNIKNVNILKGQVIVMRTCINTCYERCINRWIERNPNYNNEDLEKFKEKKLGMYKWYKSLNTFLENIDKL